MAESLIPNSDRNILSLEPTRQDLAAANAWLHFQMIWNLVGGGDQEENAKIASDILLN